jgi:hypothetical protein
VLVAAMVGVGNSIFASDLAGDGSKMVHSLQYLEIDFLYF